MIKKIMMAIMLLVSMMAIGSAEPFVSTVSIDGENVLISDGDVFSSEESIIVEKGEEFEIKVRIYANESANDIEVMAEVLGYEYSKYDESLRDESGVFDMQAGDTKFVKLQISIPTDAEKDSYDLRVRVASRKGFSQEVLVGLRLDGQRHDVIIKDIQLDNTAIAGRSIIGNVRVENIGQGTENSVKITLSIPDLGISDSEYIDDLDEDDSTTSEDLLLRIPVCADEGFYDVEAEVTYSNGHETTTKLSEIKIVKSEFCEKAGTPTTTDKVSSKTIVTVPGSQEIQAGNSAVYPIVISNLGSSAKTYVITVSSSVDAFATYRIDPSNVMIVGAESTETAYLYLTVDSEIQPGLKDFKVTVKTDGESKDVALTASIVSKAKDVNSDSLKIGLQISLLVLVVILLILLIIFGFNKMKQGKDGDEEEVGQTYY